MIKLDIPTCPDCGRLAEWLSCEVYCDHCIHKFFAFLIRKFSRQGQAAVIAYLKQAKKLGIGLDRRPNE